MAKMKKVEKGFYVYNTPWHPKHWLEKMVDANIQKEEYPELSPYERQKMLQDGWIVPKKEDGMIVIDDYYNSNMSEEERKKRVNGIWEKIDKPITSVEELDKELFLRSHMEVYPHYRSRRE